MDDSAYVKWPIIATITYHFTLNLILSFHLIDEVSFIIPISQMGKFQ